MSTNSFSLTDIPNNIHFSANNTYCQGSVINEQYYIDCVLASGTMGRVFKCRDLMTGKETVVKSVNATPFIYPERQDAIAREIQNWMKLPKCSNLVNITAVFYSNADQTLFFAMPYIRGHQKYGLELKDWMKTYRFSELDMLYTGIAVCQAMKVCLEQTGSVPVHGDIKPSNILLEYNGERFENQPFLSCNIRLADCGAMGQTNRYLPKEYIEHKVAADNASDVYALITVLHDMEEYASESYDKEHSAIQALYKLLIIQKQWKIYNLAEVLEDFLLPICEARFEINPEVLLYKESRSHAVDVFYRVQDIHNELQMVRKDNMLLEEIDSLWREANCKNYAINGIPLTCYINRHYFVCAELCARYELAEQILCRYEKAFWILSSEQQKVFGYTYSLDIRDDFAILHARLKVFAGQNSAARSLFHGVNLEQCFCYKWLDQYIEVCSADALEGRPEEGRYIQTQLRNYVGAFDQKKGMRMLTELEMYLGIITMNLGEIGESVPVFEKCVDRYPDDLEFLYYYGYALLLDGQVSKSRYPLHILYYHCQAVRERDKDENDRPLYPAQTIAMYSHMSAYMSGDFMIALKDIDEFELQLSYYQGHSNNNNFLLAKRMTREAYDIHYQLRNMMEKMSAEEICQNFIMYCMKWKEYLTSPSGYMAYLYKRGELQVLMDLHTRFADLMLANSRSDELIRSCQYMLSILKDSGTVKFYLARAYVMKGDYELATRFYIESANMLKYEHPQLKRDGTDSEFARRERLRIRKEMKMFGLDEALI